MSTLIYTGRSRPAYNNKNVDKMDNEYLAVEVQYYKTRTTST